MPEKPTYADVEKFAKATTDRSKGISGICLRGEAGLGREHGLRGHAGEHVWRTLVSMRSGSRSSRAQSGRKPLRST